MQLVRFNPTRDLFNVRQRMDSVFDDLFNGFFDGSRTDMIRGWNPKVDIFEEDDHIVMKAELPGVEKDKIAIDVNGRVLTVKGERSSDNEVKEERYTLRERFFGRFERSFTLPAETDSEQIKAEYKDGVLKLNIPKPETGKPKRISIQ
ncbi:molecular chaperone [Desulfosarcina alkanivorans]|uniref:Molecular chaperone n=1 Tax=Desulfosarcina alkanivorans TaxID=571177 RepID=A0A5K7YVR4_9BACT|nr:Hsp20/alpha crystallin family protein [Desulfosarcina alkanivorans]BBO68757.1 molecular chaperone [Desulfosarcina alkanivorans]